MKKSMMAVAVALLLPGCSNEPEIVVATTQQADTMKTVTITFEFSHVTMESMTRSTLAESQMTDIWLFDYLDGSLVKTKHQQSTDDGFGSVAVTADTGEHSFCFVASRGTNPTVTDGEITWEKPSDTFWQKVTMAVTPQTATAQSVELQRVATRLRISITDEVPSTLSKLSITSDTWHCGLDALTGNPTAVTERQTTISVPANYLGTTGTLAASIFGICGDDFTTDVTVTALGENDAIIASVSLESVPMARNTTTNYSGPLFTRQPTFALTTADDWGEEVTMTW